MDIEVREITNGDILPLVDYWFSATPEFLMAMGVDLNKMITKDQFTEMLNIQILTPYTEKQSFALILWVNGKPVGHCNIGEIVFGHTAKLHLHIWYPDFRNKGIGTEIVKRALPIFFERFKLQSIISEPYALNPGPNSTLPKAGFRLIKTYQTTPGFINFEQMVNQYKINRDEME